MDTNVQMKFQQSTWRKFGILNWDMKNQKETSKGVLFPFIFGRFFGCIFFCVSPTLPGAIWAKWVFIDSCVICFQKIFSPIWTIWVWTKSCWGPCGKSFGPKRTFRTFLPSQQKLFSKANKANLLFSRFFRPLFQPLFWPIWTFGLCTKSCWDPFRKSSGPTWKSRPSVPAQQKPLSKSIWANLDFIQCCSTCSKKFVLAYLDLWALYEIRLGSLQEFIWTKLEC